VGNVIKSQIVTRDTKNLLNYTTWVAGNSSATGFSRNGGAAENLLVNGLDPWGNETVLWLSLPDGGGNDDGGWNTTNFSIDHTKLYRFSVWVKRTVYVEGRFYFGTNGFGSTNGVLSRSTGTNNTNPYFWTSSDPPTTAEMPNSTWILVVGHVWPSGSGTGANKPESGRYTIGLGRYAGISLDFVWRTESTQARHRTYLYYAESNLPRQYWCYPRVDIVDGTEPTIAQLLGGYGALSSVSLQKSNFLLGPSDTVSYYETSQGGYWNGILPASGGYTIYLGNPATAGASASPPVIYTASSGNDLVTVSGVVFRNTFSSASDVLSWAAPQNDILIVNREYEPIVTSGLVLNLDAGFTPSYPTTGTTWYDLSGNGFNGTLVNSPTYSSNEGGIITFDGINDYVEIADATSLNFGTGGFTILMWVGGIPSYPGSAKTIIRKGSRFDGNVAGWSIVWAGSPQDLYFIISSSTARLEGRTSPNGGLNGWSGYKLIGVQRSGTNWNQINNTTVTTLGTFSGDVNNTLPITISYNSQYASYLNQQVGMTLIYNRALSSAEITQVYNATKARYGL
jgi:hypothetical protein